jgi:hypothetical protein
MEFLAAKSFLKIIGDFGSWGALIILLLYVALVVYAFSRAGSSYFIVDKIWKLTSGEKEFKNKDVNGIWEDIRDVEAFRFRTKINVSTYNQIIKIKAFLESKDMGYHDIIPFAKYFDTEKIELKKYNYSRRRNIYFILLMTSYLLLSIPQFITSFTNFNYNKSAYLTFKESQRVIYLQKEQAFIEGQILTAENCKNLEISTNATAHKISVPEAEAICNELRSEDASYYKETIKEQRTVVILWVMIFIIFMIIFARKALSLSKAIDFKKRIDTSQS